MAEDAGVTLNANTTAGAVVKTFNSQAPKGADNSVTGATIPADPMAPTMETQAVVMVDRNANAVQLLTEDTGQQVLSVLQKVLLQLVLLTEEDTSESDEEHI